MGKTKGGEMKIGEAASGRLFLRRPADSACVDCSDMYEPRKVARSTIDLEGHAPSCPVGARTSRFRFLISEYFVMSTGVETSLIVLWNVNSLALCSVRGAARWIEQSLARC